MGPRIRRVRGSLVPMIHIKPQAKIVCPHCGVASKGEWDVFALGRDRDGDWRLFVTGCADCERLVMMLREYTVPELTALTSIPVPGQLKRERMVWPRAVSLDTITATG